MIRRILGLMVLAGLTCPVSCLSDVGPNDFTTKNTCLAGEVEGCECDVSGAAGKRLCKSDGTFGECRCLGCSMTPDCKKCSKTCLEQCICNSTNPDRETECTAKCKASDGGRHEDGGVPR